MLKSKPSSLYRVDEDEVAVGNGGGGGAVAPTEAQMKLAIAQTLSMGFAYNAPVVVLKFDVAENGNITGVFKDAARPRVFSFTLDGESVAYKPYKPGKMDSLESEEDVQEWEAFSEGYSFRVDAGVGGAKKPQCVKPTAYNCGSACINVNKNCKSNAKDSTSKDRVKKLSALAKSYHKEYIKKSLAGDGDADKVGTKWFETNKKALLIKEERKKGKGSESQAKSKAESKKPIGQKMVAKKTAESEVKIEPKPEVKPKTKSSPKSSPKSKANPFYSDEPIKDYDTFKKEIPKELARVNFENNYDGLIPVSKVKEELKGRISNDDFDNYIKQIHSESDDITLATGSGEPGKDAIKTPVGKAKDFISFSNESAMKTARKEIKRKPGQITELKDFEKEIDNTFGELGKKYNDLVPIHVIRDRLGDKVSKGDFNNLMVNIMENDRYLLQAGEMSDITPAKREKSITLPSGDFRYYLAKVNDN
jgi:hypothetical protein